jgi:hypothetical protein
MVIGVHSALKRQVPRGLVVLKAGAAHHEPRGRSWQDGRR